MAKRGEFPRGGIDFIRHDLRVRFASEKGKSFSETVSFAGAMTIQRADPYRAKDGRATIDFKVLSWVASGWSEKLGASIVYALTEDVDQPVSRIVSDQRDRDFPATFHFDVIFDVRVNNEPVFRRLHGRPIAAKFREIPPTGNRRLSPVVRNFEDLNQVTIAVPDLGVLVGKPIDCKDQEGFTLRELAGIPLVRPLGLAGRGR